MSAVLQFDRRPLLFSIGRARRLVGALTQGAEFADQMEGDDRESLAEIKTRALVHATLLERELGDVRMADLSCDEIAALNGHILREPHDLRIFNSRAEADTFKAKYLAAYPVEGYGTGVNIHPIGHRFEVRCYRMRNCE